MSHDDSKGDAAGRDAESSERSGDDQRGGGGIKAPAPRTRSDEPIPRLPRGKGISLSGPQLVRIAMFIALLVAVLFLRQPCADGIANFMGQFDPKSGDASVPPSLEPLGTPSGQAHQGGDEAVRSPSSNGPGEASTSGSGYIRLRSDMSDDEIKKALEQAGLEVDESAEPSRDAGPAGDARAP